MQVDQMRAFLVVAEEPSLRRAALRLHLSQPALSERILRLEQSLGVCLLERSPSGSVLTPAGRRLLPAVQDAVRAVDDVMTAAAADGPVPASVRLGVLADGVEDLTWPVVQAVRGWSSRPQVLVSPVSWSECLPRLLDGSLDAVLTRGPYSHERVEVTTLATGSVGVLVSSRNDLAGADVLAASEVAQRPTLRPPDTVDAEFRRFWTQEDSCPGRQTFDTGELSVLDLAGRAEQQGVVGLFPTRLAGTALLGGATFRPLLEDLRCPLQVLTRRESASGRAVAASARAVALQLVPLLPDLHGPRDAQPG